MSSNSPLIDDDTASYYLNTAQEAVSKASDLIRHQTPKELTVKGDRDLASDIDFAVERLVRDFLVSRAPEVGFLGEEGRHDTPDDLMWVLDPVDGTINLLHDLPLCAVSLSLVEKDITLSGVIELPFFQAQYSAYKGKGAYVNGRRLTTNTTDNLKDALISIDQYTFDVGGEKRNQERILLTKHLAQHVQRVRVFGSSALELAWTAEGRLDASIMLANKRWDTSAGVLIAREAGVRVLDRDGSIHTSTSSATIAVTPGLESELMTIIKKILA